MSALILAVSAFAASPCFGQHWAEKMFTTTEHDFGTVARGSKAEFLFTLSNIYMDEVHIVTAYSSCGCTSVDVDQTHPQDLRRREPFGPFSIPRPSLARGPPQSPWSSTSLMPAEVLLHVRGVIRGDVVFEPGSVQLGDVAVGTPVQRTVRVSRWGWGDWQVTDIKSSNPHVSAKVVNTNWQDGWKSADLSVTLDNRAPLGYVQDHLVLVTSEGQNIQLPLAVEGRVISELCRQPIVALHGRCSAGRKGDQVGCGEGGEPVQSAFDHLRRRFLSFRGDTGPGEGRSRDSRDFPGRQYRGKDYKNDSNTDRSESGIARTPGLRGDFHAGLGQQPLARTSTKTVLFAQSDSRYSPLPRLCVAHCSSIFSHSGCVPGDQTPDLIFNQGRCGGCSAVSISDSSA